MASGEQDKKASLLRLLYPGLHLKRWLALLVGGVLLVALGFAYFVIQLSQTYLADGLPSYPGLSPVLLYLDALIVALIGAGVTAFALWRFYRALRPAIMPSGGDNSLVEKACHYYYLGQGPKIVAIGGGHGLSTLLHGLKEHTANLTAIVTVADDGGSSGRLRRELGVLPPGDFRNCIAALADAEPLMTKLFQYRFSEGAGLKGHSFGNLFIVAMSGVTGSFERAINESSRILAVSGQILPATLTDVTLCARADDESTIQGECNIPLSGRRIKQVYLEPERVQAYPEAMRTLMEADLIIAGPGSLYTSILPNLLVEGIKEAVAASSALKVYVCNVATERGETDGFAVADHVEVLERHLGPGLFHYVIANSNTEAVLLPDWGANIVTVDSKPSGVELIMADVVNEEYRLRHDPRKLAAALLRLYGNRGKR